ncbi:MAG: type IV secretory system conjugative DNA transfer family protein [Faecousia sp.]
MIKTVLEGLQILPAPPHFNGVPLEPIVQLRNGLVLDDGVFESPTLLLGSVGSGKSSLLDEIMDPILRYAEAKSENAIIFCAKEDFLMKYRRPGDPVIAVDAIDPSSCWNVFQELAASTNPELTARDIAKSLTRDQRSEIQPFFENAANDILFNTIMCMYEDGLEKHITYSNWDLVDLLNKTSIESGGELTWNELARLRPKRFAHIKDYLGDNLGQGYGVISEIRTLIHDCFWGSFCSDRGEFSAIETLRIGGKRVFLYYDLANASEASIKIFRTILNLLLKHSVDQKNDRRTWFFLDEASLLPKTCIADAMSLGRAAGFRLFMCLQSAQLLTRHYKEDEAKTLLSLFPNVICMKVQDPLSRSILAERYGECLCSFSFAAPMQKVVQHVEYRPVVADYDFSLIQKKGDAICSIPILSTSPFFYHGHQYRKELETV